MSVKPVNVEFLPHDESFDILLPHKDGFLCFDVRYPFAAAKGATPEAAIARKEQYVAAVEEHQVAVWPTPNGWCCRSMTEGQATAVGGTQRAAFYALALHLQIAAIPAEPEATTT